ncbi:MAG: GNAT family N-acetyltransferase [Candidatus Sumerlaeia bacterium]|nr:GNAT family N-acetyltransferase [Candidatus Sumerlaeia bacterium]
MKSSIAQISGEILTTAPLTSPEEFRQVGGGGPDMLILPQQENSAYTVGYAVSPRCVDQALRLRYSIFNEELGEGLMSSQSSGLDRDEFDEQMDHLILIEKSSASVIGTYRLQPVRRAMKELGTYSAREYEISPLEPIFDQLLETGRACIARQHRNYFTIMHLWKGIGAYMEVHRLRYLFGCCSLTSLDPDDGWRAMKTLRARNAFHETLNLQPTADFSCGDPSRENDPEIKPGYKIPKLFSAYLTMGAKVISQPAVDREFGTVDFLVLLDSKDVNYSNLAKARPRI